MGSIEESSAVRGDLETIHSHGSQVPNGIHTSKSYNHDRLTSYDGVSGSPLSDRSYPIAICGLAMRLPGGIRDAQSFWDFIVNKKDARTRVPNSRYNVDSFHSSAGKTKSVIPQHGYFLKDAELGCLDTSFFSMSKDELEKMDPQQRQFLEVTRECLENANETGWRGKRVGCYVGAFGEDWLDSYAKDTQVSGLHRIQGYGDWTIANRTSYEFDFKGPSMTIRTACSSALTGLHEACEALRTNGCTSAIVGGTNLILTPTMTIAMSEQGVLSPEGSCKTFDAKADGYARGEAITALYLKRLDHALRDGNPVRAVIRSTAINCDGKTPGLSYPSSEAHEALIRQAYSSANLSVDGTAFVECHGTGTAIGDPLETTAIGNVFRSKGVYIGSVKPNLGHSEGASGISSIIKMVLALENKTIPPNIKFTEPNPKIPFHTAKLKVPTEAAPWPSDREERVGVNSFGIGGSNAHVILDSAASFIHCRNGSATANESQEAHLLVFSANTAESLRKMVVNYQDYVAKYPNRIQQLSYALSCQREPLTHRAFCVADSSQKVIATPLVKAKGTPRLVMVFTGQGAQWPQMGRDLILRDSTFRCTIRAMDHVLSALDNPPPWTIEDELVKPKETSRLDDTEFAQPLCTAVQVALVDTLAKYGIRADAVVGHSSGEIAAAYAAGALDAGQAIVAAYQRGQIAKGTKNAGGMAAVGLGRDRVAEYLVGRNDVVIACENSPNSVTISGESEGLDIVLAAIQTKEPDCFTRKLRVNVAYHSHLMKLVGDRYISLIEGKVVGQTPVIPFFSSVLGRQLNTKSSFGPRYWQANLESPVLFNSAVSAILESDTDHKIFLEVGPHPALGGPLRQIFKAASSKFSSIGTLQRNKQDVECLLESLGHLFTHAVPVDFSALFGSTQAKGLTDLPLYPWNHETTYWNESRLSRDWRFRKFPHHDLLGSRVTESTDGNPSWRNNFLLKDVPWVRDHKIHEDIVFPFAAYVAMAGEAVRQLKGGDEPVVGFSLRLMVVNAALVLQESQTSEIITSLVPRRLTDSLESTWYNFTISSYNGRTWVKHCVGQVRAASTFEAASTPPIEACDRSVPSPSWYAVMRRIGLNYGPAFQGLGNISASVRQHAATATTANAIASSESDYLLHPTTIDHCLQAFSCASSQGISRNFTQLAVPTHVEELEVAGTHSLVTVRVSATSTTNGSILGRATGVDASGKPVLTMRGVKLSPLESDAGSASDSHAAAVLKWQPDIDFLTPKELIRPLPTKKEQIQLIEKLALACIVESDYLLKGNDGSLPHLKKFRAWLSEQVSLVHAGEYRLVEEPQAMLSLSSEDRQTLIKSLADQIQATTAAAFGEIVMKVFQNCKSIVNNEEEPLPILYADNALQNLYDLMDACNRTDFLTLLGQSKPRMKILEIGAGTGGTTEQILRDLRATTAERTYSTYTFTDISAGFFVAAKERFKNVLNVEYAVLDISQDPLAQGFEAQSYDLILATNVLHATPSLVQTLKNVRTLLRPDGRLLLQELCPVARWVNYVMGVLPGWWLGELDGRPSEPFVCPERWTEELRAAGFAGTEAVIYDDEPPYHINAIMVARLEENHSPPKSVTLLTCGNTNPVQQMVERHLVDAGYHIDFCTLDQVPPAKQDIISLLDAVEPFFDNISAERFELLKRFVTSVDSSGLLWPTKSTDPRYAQVLGVARTLRSEMSLAFGTLETTDFEPLAILKVFQKFQHRNRDFTPESDNEFAVRDDIIHISRFQPHSVHQQLLERPADSGMKRLEIGRPGKLHTLQWMQYEAIAPADDEVEVEIKAVGMNFKDVLVAMGILELNNLDLGHEGAGIVRRVGASVKTLSVGDRVLTFTSKCFSTLLNTPADLCAKIPDDLDFASAATMPCVYGTVIYSLIDVARLQPNESILIHSACGGVGLAAIQIAQMIGAQVFGTVGTEEKVRYLVDTFGVSRERIFNSRDASFLSEVMRETDGRGVDVVLNSLSGELLHASWQCVASFGRMVEIGKRDFMGHGDLAMNPFLANRSFFGIDLTQVIEGKRVLATRLLEDCVKYYRQGSIQPIRPIKSFPASEIQDCFRYMQKGLHIGKIVCEMPDAPLELKSQRGRSSLAFKEDFAYLLVGGLGGLGRAVATWMVENGARHLVFLSRSAGQNDSDREFFEELAASGCTTYPVMGSVAQMADVDRAVSASNKPIKGALQMSMVLRDQSFSQMTHQQWTEVTAPKVQGTWNLHEALGHDLDFFVLFSSIAGTLGNNGQANYAAANTFLDAFVPFRHQLGLPASVLDIGVMQDIGYVSRNPAILKQMKAAGAYTLYEQDLLDALQAAIGCCRPELRTHDTNANDASSPSQIILGLRSTLPLSDPTNRTTWKNDARAAIYHNMDTSLTTSSGSSSSSGDQSTNELKHFLSQIQANPSTLSSADTLSFFTHQIIRQFSQLLLIPEEDIDAKQSPVNAGMDSLIAIEVKSWWKRGLGGEISVLEVMNVGSIEMLGKRAVEELKAKYAGVDGDTGDVVGDGEVDSRDPKYLAMKAP